MALCGIKLNNFFGAFCPVPKKAAPLFGSLLIKYFPLIPLLQIVLEGATHRHALLQVAEDFDFQGKRLSPENRIGQSGFHKEGLEAPQAGGLGDSQPMALRGAEGRGSPVCDTVRYCDS